MSAANYTMEIEQGATFSLFMTLRDSEEEPIDLTGYTGRGQMRELVESSTKYDFTVSFNEDATDGIMKILMPATLTTTLPVQPSNSYTRAKTAFCYDVELIKADGTILRVLQGIANVSPEVTR